MLEAAEKEKITEQLIRLVQIDNASLQERAMADAVEERLDALGVVWEEDDTWKKTGGTAGNIFARIPGTGAPVLLCAHLDSVAPAVGKQAVVGEDGRITSLGNTVLGADDLAGVTEILETVRILQEQKREHRPIEILFTYAEELYDVGSEFFDFGKISAKEAYVLDSSGCSGTFLYKAPTIISFEIEITGRAAHAGFEPERGIHAIRIAAEILSQIQMGHIGEDTTVNVGEICGGTGTNIVPERCVLRGEIRSYVHEKAQEELAHISEIAGSSAQKSGASAVVSSRIGIHAYETTPESAAWSRMKAACSRLNFPFLPKASFGGSDNNVLSQHGIEGIVLACGMEQVHSVNEYTTVQALAETTELLLELVSAEQEEKRC